MFTFAPTARREIKYGCGLSSAMPGARLCLKHCRVQAAVFRQRAEQATDASKRNELIEPTDRLPIRPPVCPDCLKQMRFVASLPDGTDTAMWHVMFVCDCGRTSDQSVGDA